MMHSTMVAVALLALLFVFFPAHTVAQADDCRCDVLLVLDASGSILQSDWPKMQNFATVIVSDLSQGGKMGPNGTRVGIVTFSNGAQLDQPLSGDPTAVTAAINGLQKTQGTTNTAAAIQIAMNELVSKKRDPDACQTIKLVTDGMSNEPAATIAAAAAARNANITIVAIGVGPMANSTELELVASEPKTKNALMLTDFTGLDQLAHALFDKCANPVPPALNLTQSCMCDVMIVLDSSGSIPPTEWERVRDFARVYANAYKSRLFSRQVRMGLITYSTQPVLNVGLTYDFQALMAGINSAPRLAGTTNTAAALTMASTELIQNQGQNLKCQTIKVVTDGRSNDPPTTASVAYGIKTKLQMEILAVGVGTGISRQELNAMASDPLADNVLILQDFGNLTQAAHQLADSCDADLDTVTPTADPVSVCHCDVYLLLDSSGNINPATEWPSMKTFAKNLVGGIYNYLGANDVRVTIIQYATTAVTVVKQSYNYNELMGAISNMQVMNGSTNTYLALDMARQIIETDTGNIDNCKLVKVVTDGTSSNPAKTAASAHLLKKLDNAQVMAIAVGNGVNNPEIPVLVSPPMKDNTINVTTWQALQQVPTQLVSQCNHTITPSPLLPAATPTPLPVDDCNCDMMIVLDNSGSIAQKDWIKMLDFARVIVNSLTPVMAPNKARIGIVKYSTAATLISGLTFDASALLRAIGGMGTVTGGVTRTDLGLTTAENELLRSPRSIANKCKTIKLVTDGVSTVPAATITVAHRVKAYRIYLVAVGVGSGVNVGELNSVASAPITKNVILLKDFTGLDQLAHVIGDKCNTAGTNTPTPLPFANDPCHCDYALVLDTSGSIGAEFPKVINFATSIVNNLQQFLNPNDNDTRVAIISFATTASVVSPLTGNYNNLMTAINKMPKFPVGGTNIAAGIQQGMGQLNANSRGLGSCKKMVVLTDGVSSSTAQTVAQAHIAKSQYMITITAVGVGSQLNMNEINNMASAPLATNAIKLNDFDALARTSNALTGQCSKNGTATPYQTDCSCDIMLVLDGSGSVPMPAWQQIEDFCVDMVQGWANGIGNGTTRIGIVTYGATTTLVRGLSNSTATLLNDCANLVKPNGGTPTDQALATAGTELRTNGGACRAIKLLTDGNSNNPAATDAVAESLKLKDRIHIQAVGIGSGINMNELRDVATAPVSTNAINIKDFSGLSQVAHGITDKCSNAVYNQKSVCQYTNMMRCTVARITDRCQLPTLYQTCAAQYACPDVLKYLCATQFTVSTLYKTCPMVSQMCATAAQKSACQTATFQQCQTDANKFATTQCARLNRYVACATSTACQDMVQAYCTGSSQGCTLTGCTYLQPVQVIRPGIIINPTLPPIVQGGAVIRTAAEQEAIDASLNFLLPDGEHWNDQFASKSNNGVAIAAGLALLVAVLAGALVGLIVRHRRQALAAQVELEENMLA